MMANVWRLCSGDLPDDAIAKLESLTQTADEMRVLVVALLASAMEVADQYGSTEVGNAAHRAAVAIANAELPLVALKNAGRA
jgi:hypothetical protein